VWLEYELMKENMARGARREQATARKQADKAGR
jgi:hypothetical protein